MTRTPFVPRGSSMRSAIAGVRSRSVMPRLARPPSSVELSSFASGKVPRVTETAFFSLPRRTSSLTVAPGLFEEM